MIFSVSYKVTYVLNHMTLKSHSSELKWNEYLSSYKKKYINVYSGFIGHSSNLENMDKPTVVYPRKGRLLRTSRNDLLIEATVYCVILISFLWP